jgi:hypothetical protein
VIVALNVPLEALAVFKPLEILAVFEEAELEVVHKFHLCQEPLKKE